MKWMWPVLVPVMAWMLGSTLPAAAQEPDAGESAELLEVFDRALVALVDEIGHLVVLDRFETPVPDPFQPLPELLGLVSIPDAQLRMDLENIDNIDGPNVLGELHRLDALTGGAADDALWTNVPRWDPVDPRLYVVAYDALLAGWWLAGGSERGLDVAPIPGWQPAWDPETVDRWVAPDPDFDFAPVELRPDPEVAIGVEPATVPEEVVDKPAPVADPEPDPGTTSPAVDPNPRIVADAAGLVPAPAPTATPSAGFPWGLVSLALAGVLALVGLMALLGRGRSRRAPMGDAYEIEPQEPNLDAVLEAGRRFLGAASIEELGERVVAQASRLCDATGAVFACDEGTWTAGAPPALPRDLVAQARSTGRTVASDGAVIVPVVAAGRVLGVICVANPAHGAGPVEQLAPLVGEGLASVAQRSATQQLAFVDGLTSVPNRRRFDLDLAQRSQEAAAGRSPVAVAMIDVDHFKTYNDTNGHPEGDEALRVVARLIAENLRAEDTVYRYGGEEFAVLLPGADLDAARAVVERIRSSIEAHPFRGGPTQPGGRVTVSVGVAAAPPPDGGVMLEAADAALYRAKTQGRNQVVLGRPPS